MNDTTATPRRVYRTAQIKPATRDALKDVLASAADALADKQREVWAWQALAERDPVEEAPQLSAPLLLAIGAIVGVVCMAVAGGAL